MSFIPIAFCMPVAAADVEAAEAHHAAAADVEIHLDDDHRGAFFARGDRGRQPAGAGADDDHVGFAVPADLVRGLRLRRSARSPPRRRPRRPTSEIGACSILMVLTMEPPLRLPIVPADVDICGKLTTPTGDQEGCTVMAAGVPGGSAFGLTSTTPSLIRTG